MRTDALLYQKRSPIGLGAVSFEQGRIVGKRHQPRRIVAITGQGCELTRVMAARAFEYQDAMSSDALDRLEYEAVFCDAGQPGLQVSHAAKRHSIHRAAHQRIVHAED